MPAPGVCVLRLTWRREVYRVGAPACPEGKKMTGTREVTGDRRGPKNQRVMRWRAAQAR